VCAEPAGEVGFSFAEASRRSRWPRTRSWEVGGEPAVFDAFEVALQLALDARDLRTRRCELLFYLWPFGFGRLREVGERLLDDVAVAIQLGELREDRRFEAVLGKPVALALRRPVLVAGGAGVVGVATVASMRTRADIGAATVVAADQPREQEVARIAASEGCVFAAAAEDLLRLVEGVVVDERLVKSGMGFAVPAYEAAIGGLARISCSAFGDQPCLRGGGAASASRVRAIAVVPSFPSA